MKPKPAARKPNRIGIAILSIIGLLALAIGAFSILPRLPAQSNTIEPSNSITATGPSIASEPTEPSISSNATDVQKTKGVTPTAAIASPEAPGLLVTDGMVEIASGNFEVGSASADNYHSASKSLSLNGFWIDKYQVTFVQYQKFLIATGTQSPNVVGEGNHPVRGVTWDQAVAYCSWVNKRLPTEAEWEAAGRGSGSNPPLYPWGNDPKAGGDINSLPDQDTYEVGTLPFNKSPFGVYDMVGNIWEWVGDPYASTPAGSEILRGGRFGLPILELSYRLPVGPGDTRYIKYAGFRCAADLVK